MDERPLHSNRQHLTNDDCLEDKKEDYQNCSVLSMAVVHNNMHTHDQFLKLSVGLNLGLVFASLFNWV